MIKTLSEYMQKYNWNYRVIDDSSIHTVFKGDVKNFDLHLDCSDCFVEFRVDKLVKINEALFAEADLAFFILGLNEGVRTGTIFLDEGAKYIGFKLESVKSSLGYAEFEFYMGLVGYYTVNLYKELCHFINELSIMENSPQTYLS